MSDIRSAFGPARAAPKPTATASLTDGTKKRPSSSASVDADVDVDGRGAAKKICSDAALWSTARKPDGTEMCVQATVCTPDPLRKAFDVLGSMFDEIELTFTERGVQMEYHNSDRVAMTKLILNASEFSRYRCDQRIRVGVFMSHLCDFMRSAKGPSTMLTMSIPRHCVGTHAPVGGAGAGGCTYMRVEISNTANGSHETNDMAATMSAYVEDTQHEAAHAMPCTDTNIATHCNVITMRSSDLKDIVKKIEGSRGDTVTISVQQNEISFSAAGEAGSKKDTRQPSNALRMRYVKDVTYRFPLQYLKGFTKANSVNDVVILYIGAKLPLMLCYRVWTLGELWFALSSCNTAPLGVDALDRRV